MSEKIPVQTNQSESESNLESLAYERILEAVRTLRAHGAEDPLNVDGNPEAQDVLDILDQWEMENGIHMRGVGTTEKAAKIVQAATIWISAGYTGSEFFRDALMRLNDQHADALREGNDEVTKVLRDAIDDLEGRLSSVSPKEKISILIETKFEEAQGLIQAGRLLSAIGTLSAALLDPRFKGKRMSDEQRARFRELLDATKAREREESQNKKK